MGVLHSGGLGSKRNDDFENLMIYFKETRFLEDISELMFFGEGGDFPVHKMSYIYRP
jgi:hypothetical protein